MRAHHGSIAREERLEIEESLKAGRLPAMVATSSLELGIDMGAIDLVVQIETPPSVASGMQRIGRASHQAGAVSRGIIFPKYRGDLLSTAAITRAMVKGDVEATRIPANPLDVLAQQLVAICAGGERPVGPLFSLVRRAAPFAKLPRAHFDGVLDMLSGRYPSDEFAELRPRLTWDRLRGVVRARDGAQRLAVTNAGTIPDRGLYGVFLAGGDAPSGPRRGKARGGAGRGDGLREPRGRRLRAGSVELAHHRDHARSRARRPGAGRAGADAFLEGRPTAAPRRPGPRGGPPLPRAPRDAAQRSPGTPGEGALPRTRRSPESPRLPGRAARGHGRSSRRPHPRAGAHPRRDGGLAALPALTLGRPRSRPLDPGPAGATTSAGRGGGRDALERRRDRRPPAGS